MPDCIFCKIINREADADIVFENERIIVFGDIKPSAPIHWLIVPKGHKWESINDIQEEDKGFLGEMILVAKQMAEKAGIAKSGYKLIFNVGRGGGQIIDHLHLHLMGGW